MLTHHNPYKGKSYVEEPAIAVVEFVNVNSLIEAWMEGWLRGENTRT